MSPVCLLLIYRSCVVSRVFIAYLQAVRLYRTCCLFRYMPRVIDSPCILASHRAYRVGFSRTAYNHSLPARYIIEGNTGTGNSKKYQLV